jgi:hypothetical protein
MLRQPDGSGEGAIEVSPMPRYEVAAKITARKYFEIEAKNMKQAVEFAKQNFADLWPSLDEEWQKREGISIDEDAKFEVTNIIER